MEIKADRRIVVRDYYGPGQNLYADELGWRSDDKKEAGSLISKEIWEYFICTVGLNISFYFPENDTFYGLHTEEIPYTLYRLPRDRNVRFIGRQCSGDTHEYGEPVFETDSREALWDNIHLDGHTLEYVINHSYIINMD